MTDNSSQFVVVLSTAPSVEEGRRIARDLVENRLAACVNLVPGLVSIYEWEGKIAEEAEVLLIMKTRGALVDELTGRIVEIHPYDCPEVVALGVSGGHGKYFDWIESVTGSKTSREESGK